jgi:membrane fusion protein, multidrug efflux system
MSRFSPTLAFAAPLLALGITACAKHEAVSNPVRPVLTHRVALSTARHETVYSGEVRARHEADLGFRIAGKIVSRHVEVGALVRKGTLLAKLDPADARLAAVATRAQVAAAQTEFEFARSEHDRYQKLLRQNFVGQSAYDAKLNALKAARARLQQARSQYAVSRNQTGYTSLFADQDGVITAISAEAGQVVSAGQPVMRLARLEEKEAVFNVPESRVAALQAADSIAVKLLAVPERAYTGKVREVAPNADSATRTFSVKVSILDPTPEVKLGMTANVALGSNGDRVATVPLGAIYSQDGTAKVWVVDPKTGKVNLRPVTLNAYREDGVTIANGLEDGELVVVAGVHQLTPGQQVAVSDTTVQASSR